MTVQETEKLELNQDQSYRHHPGYTPLYNQLIAWADNTSDVTEEMVDKKAPKIAGVVDQLEEFEVTELLEFADKVAQDVKLAIVTKVPIGNEVGNYIPWLEDRWRSAEWAYWDAYRRFLLRNKRPFGVVNTLEADVKRILDMVGDPTAEGWWDRRGLVIGDVQSGKTSNYIGLLNMAADAGYRLFIIIGGHTEDLRQQTQERIDEGFLGKSTADADLKRSAAIGKLIGVGEIAPKLDRPIALTGVSQDFSSSSASVVKGHIDNSFRVPLILVVKKNARILRNLAGWLGDQTKNEKLSLPMLVIDDESDYASVDTSKEEDDPTAVNKAITDLLDTSARNSYIGFTATPFANVLMDPANAAGLFPKDYVYSLYAPDNYLGALQYFDVEDPSANGVRNDVEDAGKHFPFKHRSSLAVKALPDSLHQALDTFLVANAIRDLDGASPTPRSMLINVSRFKAVQKQVYDLVREYVDATRAVVQESVPALKGSSGNGNEVVERLHATWQAEYSHLKHSWLDVRAALPEAVRDIEIELVNGDTDKQRKEIERRHQQYGTAKRRRRIAVGGAILSRGLTLDGLMVSYFHQRTQLSDTLLQMGRWFGYRDGYRHLVRLWLPEDVMDWFVFTGRALQDIRDEVVTMKQANLTPKDFGLKVRRHPEALKVTAANKMRHAESATVDVSFYRQTVESISATDATEEVAKNFAAYQEILSNSVALATESNSVTRMFGPRPGAEEGKSETPHLVFTGVERAVVERFLESFVPGAGDANFAHGDGSEAGSWVSKFAKGIETDQMSSWDVAFMSGQGDAFDAWGDLPEEYRGKISPVVLKASVRNAMRWHETPTPHFEFANRRVATAGNLEQVVSVANNVDPGRRQEWHTAHARLPEGNSKRRSEKEIMTSMKRPVLMVYRVVTDRTINDSRNDAKKNGSLNIIDKEVDVDQHILGVKVAFPAHRDGITGEFSTGRSVEYVVNKVWMEKSGLAEEVRASEDEGEDVDA
ncbi:Z1 domain-containing protein [Kocuria sp. M1N1S27]|uniref:Z1 domain-containing protein n=1 Tax=Kocuria kalidii TaxID=3376283 RepID=UPI00379222D0